MFGINICQHDQTDSIKTVSSDQCKRNVCWPYAIATSSFCLRTSLDGYCGNVRALKHVAATGRREGLSRKDFQLQLIIQLIKISRIISFMIFIG